MGSGTDHLETEGQAAMSEVPMVPALINRRWRLLLPEHRAERGLVSEHQPDRLMWDIWEWVRLSDMHQRLRPGDLVYDVGAELGDLSALIASWGCRMVLLEPNPLAWAGIRPIFEANGLSSQVVFSWLGFAGEDTCLSPPNPDNWFGGYRQPAAGERWPPSAYGEIVPDHGFLQLNERPDTPRITLDDLWLTKVGEAPRAITIDTEGSELSVLRGARRLMEEVRPVIWVSVHPVFEREQYGHEPEAVLDYARSLRYEPVLLAIDHEHHYRLDPK